MKVPNTSSSARAQKLLQAGIIAEEKKCSKSKLQKEDRPVESPLPADAPSPDKEFLDMLSNSIKRKRSDEEDPLRNVRRRLDMGCGLGKKPVGSKAAGGPLKNISSAAQNRGLTAAVVSRVSNFITAKENIGGIKKNSDHQNFQHDGSTKKLSPNNDPGKIDSSSEFKVTCLSVQKRPADTVRKLLAFSTSNDMLNASKSSPSKHDVRGCPSKPPSWTTKSITDLSSGFIVTSPSVQECTSDTVSTLLAPSTSCEILSPSKSSPTKLVSRRSPSKSPSWTTKSITESSVGFKVTSPSVRQSTADTGSRLLAMSSSNEMLKSSQTSPHKHFKNVTPSKVPSWAIKSTTAKSPSSSLNGSSKTFNVTPRKLTPSWTIQPTENIGHSLRSPSMPHDIKVSSCSDASSENTINSGTPSKLFSHHATLTNTNCVQSSNTCPSQKSIAKDNCTSGNIRIVSQSPSTKQFNSSIRGSPSHKIINVKSPRASSKRCSTAANLTEDRSSLSSRKKVGKDVFTNAEFNLAELLEVDDPISLLTAHCAGPSSSVNSLAADLLIEAVTAQEEMHSQRESTIPPLLRELQLDGTQIEAQIEDIEGRQEETEVTTFLEEPVMQTPSRTARKRNSLPKAPKRKRLRDPSKWLDTIRKQAKRGKTVEPVKMKNPCACSKMCPRNISEEYRSEIFLEYYSTKSQRDKWEFITRHSESTPVVRKTTEGKSRRNSSRKYFFNIGPKGEKKKVYVCKTMFTNTLSISHAVIDTAHKHLQGGDTHILSPDKRGKHGNRPKKTSEDQRESIRQHINLYPRVPSHYCRAGSQREYLEWGLSLARMSKQYIEWCRETHVPTAAVASMRQYITVLCEEFNISFFKPKKDQCALCRLIKTGNREEREKYKDKFVKHQNNKKLARKEMHQAKEAGVNDASINVIAFDLQKVLPVPKSEVSVFFYKNKLSLYNLSVFDFVRKEGVCHLWHEAVAKRGANEIGSCVLSYVQRSVVKDGCKTVYSFSDSCGGQNKNRFFFSMMLLAAAKYDIVFQHCFLEPGHTQNENDSIHARIESEAKRKELFDMDEWIKLIESAKQKDPMYEVKIMKREDIFEFHQMVESYQQWKKDTNGKKIEWSKVKVVRAEPSKMGVLLFKYDFDKEFMTLNTKQGVVGRPLNLKTYRLRLAYDSKIPLQKKKITHLQELCKSLAIPSKYHDFYNEVISAVEEVEDDVPEDENEENNNSDDEVYEYARNSTVNREEEIGEKETENDEEEDE